MSGVFRGVDRVRRGDLAWMLRVIHRVEINPNFHPIASANRIWRVPLADTPNRVWIRCNVRDLMEDFLIAPSCRELGFSCYTCPRAMSVQNVCSSMPSQVYKVICPTLCNIKSSRTNSTPQLFYASHHSDNWVGVILRIYAARGHIFWVVKSCINLL